MRECSTIDFTRSVFPLVITEVHWETKACRKHRDRCGEPRGIRTWYLRFTYTPVSTDSLILVGWTLWVRASEWTKPKAEKPTLHIISPKESKFQEYSVSIGYFCATLISPLWQGEPISFPFAWLDHWHGWNETARPNSGDRRENKLASPEHQANTCNFIVKNNL